MRLKRLLLQGYKTFASRTEFAFDEGITAIVGPNGSGKSNFTDALRWVLGEQSYNTLRGKRTTDMIFAGSQSRPRAGMAQVILTLDNSDGWLPIDYTEVEIGRRAYRSGENEYILNGQKVRLKDVTDLLANSGLGERTYTIIGQGLIDQALSLRAEERRALFEEAAGISHYKARRAETLRRLEETQRNLERVHDILSEITPRLNSLKRQATRARNYEQLAADLRHLLRIWYGYKWEQAKGELRQARQTATTAEAAWQTNRSKLLAQQQKIDDVRKRMHHLQQQAAETQTRRESTREALEAARRNVAILQERQQAVTRQLADIEQELPALEQQQAAAKAELMVATAELEAAHSQLKETQEQLQHFNAAFQAQQAEINRRQEALYQVEERRRTTQTRLAQAEGQLSQLQERLQEQTVGSGKQKAEELLEVAEQVNRLTAMLETAQNRVDELRQKRNELQDARQTLIVELKQLRHANGEREQQLNQQRNELTRLEARVELLDQMRRQDVKVGEGIRLIGRFASLITIPGPYQRALAAALATRLGTLVLPEATDLWQLVSTHSAKQTVTAAALSHLQLPSTPPAPLDPAVIGWASHLVTVEETLRPVVQLLLGQILLVSDAQAAYRLAQVLPTGSLAVAPDGFVAHAGGLVEMNGDTSDSLLAREAEWRGGEAEVRRIKDEVAQLESMATQRQDLIQQKQDEADTLQNEERRLGRLEHEAQQRFSQAQRSLDQVKQQQSFLKRQEEAQAQEGDRLTTRIGQAEQTIIAQREAVVQLEMSVNIARASLEALPAAEGPQQRQTLQQHVSAVRTIVAGRQAVVDSRRTTLNHSDQQVARLKERQAALGQQQQQLSLADEEANVTCLQEQLARLEAELDPVRAGLDESRHDLARMEEESAAIQKQTHERETYYTQAKINLSQQRNRIEGLQDRIKADLGLVALTYDDDQTGPTPLPMTEVVEQLPQITTLPGDIEETIQNYRGQMHRLGAINSDAPAEYEATQSRSDFLSQQVEDLKQTESQLRRIIAELDELTSRAFAETVNKVNDVFDETFRQLFGGGAARLVLTDPDDLSISGVDIVARLPNRREQGLGLLSGGERSLTAAALIFSLLKVSPTPFCVMDEVDAALDEANINRFRELLQELSVTIQFVVITHNRGTLQVAQTVYGISMGADSVSQAISIKPEEYVNGSLPA